MDSAEREKKRKIRGFSRDYVSPELGEAVTGTEEEEERDVFTDTTFPLSAGGSPATATTTTPTAAAAASPCLLPSAHPESRPAPESQDGGRAAAAAATLSPTASRESTLTPIFAILPSPRIGEFPVSVHTEGQVPGPGGRGGGGRQGRRKRRRRRRNGPRQQQQQPRRKQQQLRPPSSAALPHPFFPPPPGGRRRRDFSRRRRKTTTSESFLFLPHSLSLFLPTQPLLSSAKPLLPSFPPSRVNNTKEYWGEGVAV